MTTCHGFQTASKEFGKGLDAFIIFHFTYFLLRKRTQKRCSLRLHSLNKHPCFPCKIQEQLILWQDPFYEVSSMFLYNYLISRRKTACYRITDSLGLEWTFGDQLVQAPCQGRATYVPLHSPGILVISDLITLSD